MTDSRARSSPSLQGKRILVVEDEALLSMMLEDLLTDLGCDIVGPAARLKKANELASSAPCDGALLDLNLGGEVTYGVARILDDRGIPFAFVTGYDPSWISEPYRARPMIPKPIRPETLKEVLDAMLDQPRH